MIQQRALLLLLALSTYSVANVLKKGEYRIEHPELPDYTEVYSQITQGIFEDFQYNSLDEFTEKWIISKDEMEDGTKSYPGYWNLEEAVLVPGFKNDLALTLGSSKSRSSIIYKINNSNITVNVAEKPLVIQYEVKLQKQLECGGAYMKLYTNAPSDEDLPHFNFQEPFDILFGPDICGQYADEVHLIVNSHGIEHVCNKTVSSFLDAPVTRLYTLILDFTKQHYQIRVNGEEVIQGSLENDFHPSFIPPRYLYTEKPADWDEIEFTPDMNATKPADWDDRIEIPDPMHMRPPNWNESEPELVPDLGSRKPDFWNETVNGKWIRPLVINPKCYSKTGCGKYKQIVKKNPNYQGEWTRPLIENPNYKGDYEPQQYENQEYIDFDFDNTYGFDDFSTINAIAFDLWSTASGTLFDNIYIGNSVEEAELLGNSTFIEKLEYEILEITTEKKTTETAEPLSEDIKEEETIDTSFEDQVQKKETKDVTYSIGQNYLSIVTIVVLLVLSAYFLVKDGVEKVELASKK